MTALKMNTKMGSLFFIIVFLTSGVFAFEDCFAVTGIDRSLNVRVPMRDGVELSADIWMPNDSSKHPAILIRNPYLKTHPVLKMIDIARFFSERGYAVVVQDVRGRGDSDGEFGFFFQEAEDGFDTIDWVSKQDWSNGDVCTMGLSYLGTVQWLAAKERPPNLKCMASTAAAGQYLNELPYVGGAFAHQWALKWVNASSGRTVQASGLSDSEWENALKHRPLLTADLMLGRYMPLYREFLEHNTIDSYWERIYLRKRDFENIDLPVLHTTGWFDSDQPGAMHYWNGMNKHSPRSSEQYLVVGPWDHHQTYIGGESSYGEMKFSDDSIIDNLQEHLDFFDVFLAKRKKKYEKARIRTYITGRNQWLELDEYPTPSSTYTRLYLSGNGSANEGYRNGTLSFELSTDTSRESYVYDPKDPVVSVDLLSTIGHAQDRRAIQERTDVLVFTSEKLGSAIDVLGPVEVELFASTDGLDPDFVVTIVDVYPDGRAVHVGPRTGIIRARYRNGLEKEELLVPNEIEKYRIELGHIGHAFLAGHRIRIEVTSSAYPSFNPNQNTGNPIATDVDWRVAQQHVFHGDRYPSAVVLPILNHE